jgi:hypothetical protein
VERLSFGHHPQSHKINSALWIVPVRYLAFLGQAEGPEASTETRPSDLWPLAKLPWLFLSLQNNSGTSSYSTSQACQPVPSGGHR